MDAVLVAYNAQNIDSIDKAVLTSLQATLLNLHSKFWGKPVPSGNAWDIFVDLEPWQWTGGKLLILEQYPRALELIKQTRLNPANRRGLLITGSPGIGKTSFLWYLLVTTLSDAQPVFMLFDSLLFFFNRSGVYSISRGQIVGTPVFKGVLSIVDMDNKDNDLREAVVSKLGHCFTVAATSPQRNRYHPWTKQARIATHVFDPPKSVDFQQLAEMSHIDTNTVTRRLPQLLDIYGPDVRALQDALPLPDEQLQLALSRHIKTIYHHLAKLPSVKLTLLFSSPDELDDSFSHTLVQTYGALDGHAIWHKIRTPLVLRLVLKAYQINRVSQLRQMNDLFSATALLAVSRGWVFETLCHEFICNVSSLELQPMRREGTSLIRESTSPSKVPIGDRSIEIYTLGSKTTTTVSPVHYYIPAESNNATFDSFLHGRGDHSLGFQMFIGRGHSLKKKGMTNLRKRLKAYEPTRDWKQNKIGFVFVVPQGYDFEVVVPNRQYQDIQFYTLEVNISVDQYEYFSQEERCPDGDDSDIEDDRDVEMEDVEMEEE